MILQLAVGTFLIFLTVVNHAFCFDFLMKHIAKKSQIWTNKYPRYGNTHIMVVIVLGIFFTHTIESWIWAIFYWQFTEIETLQQAIYFSTVTYTTLGYGDITLSDKWQLLASMQAVDGILMFGWSTAFLVSVRSNFWSKRGMDSLFDKEE